MATIGEELSDNGVETSSGVIGSLVPKKDKSDVHTDVEQERVSTPLMMDEVGTRVTFPNLLACGLTAEELEDLEADLETKQ